MLFQAVITFETVYTEVTDHLDKAVVMQLIYTVKPVLGSHPRKLKKVAA